MAGFPLPPIDPNQQLNQDPTQGQAPGSQPPPQQAQQPPSQVPQDPLEPIAQGLAQRIGQYQQQQNVPANQGGAFKRILGSFFQGAGSAMMKDAGIPTPYEQNQKDIQDLNTIRTTQSTANLHQAVAGMYGNVPVQIPDPEHPGQFTTAMVAGKDAPGLYKSMITGQYGVQKAQFGTQKPINVPGIGAFQYNPATKSYGPIQGTQAPLINLQPGEAQTLGLDPSITQLPEDQYSKAVGAKVKQVGQAQGLNDQFQINKLNPGAPPTPLGIGQPRQIFAPANRFGGFVDPNNPDNVVPMTYGQAAKTGATLPSSVPFQANKAVTRSAVAGPIGQSLNAFNTATEHLKLLGTLGDALDNGKNQIANNIAQKYAQVTGSAAPINFDMAKNAVVGEVAKTFKGNATEAEIASINATINRAQSPAQLKGAISTALSLMGSKKQALQQQVQQGKTGQPAFGESGGGPPRHFLGGSANGLPEGTTGNQGKYIVRGGQWVAAQ